MQILRNRKELDHLLARIRKKDLQIGLIPTMGGIHEGHLSLVKISTSNTCDKSRLFIAVYVGDVRVIDNFILY